MKFNYKIYKSKSGYKDAHFLPKSEKTLVIDTTIEADNGAQAFKKLTEQIEIKSRWQIVQTTLS